MGQVLHGRARTTEAKKKRWRSTDNGIQFTNQAHHKYAFHHIFERVCNENGIEHRLTKIKHP